MKKTIFILSIMLSIMLILTGCGASTSQPTQPVAETAVTTTAPPETTVQTTADAEKLQLIVWGLNSAVPEGTEKFISTLQEEWPDREIVPQNPPESSGNITQDLSKLVTMIAAGNPPDVFYIDRPFLIQYAAAGALTPLNEYLPDADWSQFYEYTMMQATYDNQIFCVPKDVDCRVLYYNKKHFIEAGLDPEAPPKTWSELLEYAKLLTKYDDAGNYTQVGFIPMFGNGYLMNYFFPNGGQIVSEDGKTSTLDDPRIVEALEFLVTVYDELGGAVKLNAYSTNFQTDWVSHPIVTGQVSMMFSLNKNMTGLSIYTPDEAQEYLGIAPMSLPDNHDNNIRTWSGGWAYGVAAGVKHPKEAAEVAYWLGTEGGKLMAEVEYELAQSLGRTAFIPNYCASKPINDWLLDHYVSNNADMPQVFKDGVSLATDLLNYSQTYAPTTVVMKSYDELVRAVDKALYHESTPAEALAEASKAVQPDLDG